MKKHGFSRFLKGSWEIWVSIQTYPPGYVQAYPQLLPARKSAPRRCADQSGRVAGFFPRTVGVINSPVTGWVTAFALVTPPRDGPLAGTCRGVSDMRTVRSQGMFKCLLHNVQRTTVVVLYRFLHCNNISKTCPFDI